MRPRTAAILHAHVMASYLLVGAEVLQGVIAHPGQAWTLVFIIPAPLTLPIGLPITIADRPIAGCLHLFAYGILFAVAYLRYRRNAVTAERWVRGQCLACGYDLRATPERCPECGTVSDDPGRVRAFTRTYGRTWT